MLIKEAKWLDEAVKSLPLKTGAVFLNFGSQSESYKEENEHVNEFISTIKENYSLKNLDIKPGKGIDFPGDISNESFFISIKKEKFDCILLNNVLEHVADIRLVCDRVQELLAANGFIVFTGPRNFPKHYDPIDNGFRPDIREVEALFPGLKYIRGEVVTDYTYRYYLTKNFKSLVKTILRILAPFYRFEKWKSVVIPKFAYWNQNFTVTCVILQKK